MLQGLGISGNWIGVRNTDARAVSLYQRHYSARPNVTTQTRLTHGISGPGELLTLITVTGDALFVWQHNTVARYDKQIGVNCSVFRNEGPILSSDLIHEACDLAWARWPDKRLFTYVWDAKIQSRNPGYCFKKSGWTLCGRNADGRLSILEIYPPLESESLEEAVPGPHSKEV
jgi:hypothetical protein